ncbi:Aerobic respiration control sensor protein ArcB [Lacunisphaera limnophila]|uniref:histidine kinase n=1 Tax=Lacunisphaera limnophila TaxID=1838286 RepID=A0A1D8AX96_9BACT|nr:ATP-binding protein [Lacunisphaera limnophila]AOS45522.1 Aerobic respiration control sensor protein ArcB [Lacunisphaera limnophila]
MLQAQHLFLTFRGDAIILLTFVAIACWMLRRRLSQRGSGPCISCRFYFAALVLAVLGTVAAEWAGRSRMDSLRELFAGFGPTYAAELSQHGHDRINEATLADDPLYLEIINHQKTWLAANRTIADIYTYRQDAAGRIHLIVDSETDYDRDGKYDEDREARTPIGELYDEATPKFYQALAGETVFESEIMADRWGVWVSSFAPIYSPDGRIEAGVGIDYPAETWLKALGSIRALVLGITLVLVAILLASGAFISRLRAEIEERKEIQNRLEQASESAFAASAAKSEYLALMSHEVRTPLSAILGFASILADSELNPKQRRYVDTINRAGSGLLTLLNGILDYTKAESGAMKLEHIAWAPALLVHEVMELMSAHAAQKQLQLNFDNQLPETLTLFGDPTRIRQIVLNLLSNALKFTTQGSVTVRATWQPDPGTAQHGRLTLEVADTGVGIPADKIPLLFRAFSQADTSTTRHHGGTGLGLAISKRLSDLMGGTITLQSTVGQGTTFTFMFASDSADACGLGYKPAAGDTAPPVPLWTRALVVDDARLNRELLKVMLRRLGLEADLASGGPEAVKLAAANRYAIIFTDLEMPEVDGFATASQIRAEEAPGRHVPIVAVSALTAPGTREKCIGAGMDDYLIKPVYLPALKSTVEALLPGFRAAKPADPTVPVRDRPAA